MLSGALPLGSRLRQEALATEFGVSRTPVREALRKLQATGFVQLDARTAARVVRGPTAREVREAYEVRAELEGLAAELAADADQRRRPAPAARGGGSLPALGDGASRGRSGRQPRWDDESAWVRRTTSSTR